MDRDEPLALADRCEAARVPGTAVLIIAALEVIHPKPPSEYKPRGNPEFSPAFTSWAKIDAKLRNFVQHGSLLDAAMTLVDPEHFWRVGHDGEGPDPSLFKARVFDPMNMHRPAFATAITAPLALTAAALRAKASLSPTPPIAPHERETRT